MSTDGRRVRLGFIGAGAWATENHMPILAGREDVAMVGVAQRDPAALARVRNRFGFEFATTDYRELLELDLDGVVVTSPHNLHHEHALASLRRGLHVMCEKPMTLSPTDAWQLVDEARARNLQSRSRSAGLMTSPDGSRNT